MRTGILGGSFDPIHYGHLAIADDVRAHYQLDRVLLIPARQQPFKHQQHADAEHRLTMVALACATNPAFAANDIELRRPETSYTVRTLELLRAHTDDALFFIVGADAAQELPRWHRINEFHRFADIVVVGRPETQYRVADTVALVPSLEGHLSAVAGPDIQLSSTHIRQRIAQGLPIRYLVPDTVADYIDKHGLYGRI